MSMLSVNATSNKPAPINEVPGLFDPDIPGAGLVLNLDASVVSSVGKSTNGTTVTTWTDQKNSLVATSQANTATYQMGAITLDGTDYFSIPIFAGLNLTSAMSIFVVATVKDIDVNTFGHFVCHSSGAAGYQFRYGTTPNGDARFNLAGVTDINAGVTSWQSGLRALIGVVFQGNAGFTYQKNGSQIGTTKASPNGNPISLTTNIGATNGAGEKLVGDLNQILIYNTKLSGSDLSNLQEGLLAKWMK